MIDHALHQIEDAKAHHHAANQPALGHGGPVPDASPKHEDPQEDKNISCGMKQPVQKEIDLQTLHRMRRDPGPTRPCGATAGCGEIRSRRRNRQTPDQDIRFDKLVLSQSNVRRIKAGVSVEELAEDIARRGLLQGLSVRSLLDADGVETGKLEIPAGGRRFQALLAR